MTLNEIFVGSSSEALKLAEAIGERIDRHQGTKAVLWNTLFPAGMILLERIESLPNEIAGAVLLATPDVKCSRRQERFSAPVANIVFEYGYLSARLGRKRVFIWRFDKVPLPSDLQGVTYIEDEDPDRDQKFSDWLDKLPRLTPGLPPISQVHGYSGTWNVKNAFTRWRGHPVIKEKGDSVYFDGKTFLVFQSDGKRGTGVQVGKTHVSIGEYRVKREVVNEVLKAEIKDDGTVELRLRIIRSRIVPGSERGADHVDPKLREDLVSSEFPLILEPKRDEVRTLRGPHEFERGADENFQLADEKFKHFGLFESPGLEA